MSTTDVEQAELTDPMAEAVANVAGWLDGLGDVLADALPSRLRELNEALAREEQAAQEKAQALRASAAQLQPRVAAQQRLLAREVDEALAEGNDTRAQAKRAEMAELDASLARIQKDAEASEGRARRLAAEQAENGRRVWEEEFPRICESCHAAEIALVDLLDRVWAACERFGAQTGENVGLKHWAALSPPEHGPDWPRLRAWFGGRR